MANLFSVTAPLMIRLPSGERQVIAELFPAAEGGGLVYFELHWHLQRPASAGIHRIDAEVKGEGPWKVGAAVLNVLGCQGTDPELAAAYAEWQFFLQQGAPGYPQPDAIAALARAAGARVEE